MSGVDSGLWHGPWQIAEVEFLNGCLHPESVEGAARRNRYKAAAQIHKIVARTEITRAHIQGFIKGVEAERERVLGVLEGTLEEPGDTMGFRFSGAQGGS